MSRPDTSDAPTPAPRRWKNIGVRAATGLLVGGIALIPFYLGGVFWPILVALFAARAAWEWARMLESQATLLSYLIPICGAFGVLALVYLQNNKAAVILMFIIAACAGLERIRRKRAIWASLGFLYIIIPSALLIILRGSEPGLSAQGFQNLLYVILSVVAADSGAYIGGSYFSGPKMAPKLSPNKTWSGFTSGLIFACIIGAITALCMGSPPTSAAIFAIPIVIFSVIGDFMESGFKRILQVKDTGGLLPGHGGVLDRVDSLMMAVVFVAFVQFFVAGVWPII